MEPTILKLLEVEQEHVRFSEKLPVVAYDLGVLGTMFSIGEEMNDGRGIARRRVGTPMRTKRVTMNATLNLRRMSDLCFILN